MIMNKVLFFTGVCISVAQLCLTVSAADSSAQASGKSGTYAAQKKQSAVQPKNTQSSAQKPTYTVNGKTLRQSVLEIKPLMTRPYPRNSLSGAKSLLLQQMSALDKILNDYKSQSADPLYQKVEKAYTERLKIKQKYQKYF